MKYEHPRLVPLNNPDHTGGYCADGSAGGEPYGFCSQGTRPTEQNCCQGFDGSYTPGDLYCSIGCEAVFLGCVGGLGARAWPIFGPGCRSGLDPQ